MSNLSTRKAIAADIPELVALHRRNVGKGEFSMLLPSAFLIPFYELCVSDQKSSAYVLTDNNSIIGVSIVWNDHNLLTRKYQIRIIFKLLFHLIWLVLTVQFQRVWLILTCVFERNITKIPDNVVANCVEMTILDEANRSQPNAIIAFFRMYSQNVELLRTNGNGNIWASASVDNLASVRMIKNVVKPTQILHFRNRPENTACFLHQKGELGKNSD